MDKAAVIQKDILEFQFKKYYELKIYNLLEEFQDNYQIIIVKDTNNFIEELKVKEYDNKQYRIISDFYTKETELIDTDTLHNDYTFISNSLIINNEKIVQISDYEASGLELIKIPKIGTALLLNSGDRVVIDNNEFKVVCKRDLKYYQKETGYNKIIDTLRSIENNRMSREYLDNFLEGEE